MRFACCFALLLLYLVNQVPTVDSQNNDRFNYRATQGTDYGPEDWEKVRCQTLGKCVSEISHLEQMNPGIGSSVFLHTTFFRFVHCTQQGWPDEFVARVGWDYTRNHCKWCPAESSRRPCGEHHQSPIDLQRNRAIESDPNFNFCIDVHWMAYYDSSCTFEELKKNNAFTIERHALKITQPVIFSNKVNKYINGCHSPGVGRAWGKIDFSKVSTLCCRAD